MCPHKAYLTHSLITAVPLTSLTIIRPAPYALLDENKKLKHTLDMSKYQKLKHITIAHFQMRLDSCKRIMNVMCKQRKNKMIKSSVFIGGYSIYDTEKQ